MRDFGDAIPTKKCAQAASELIVQERKQIFKDLVKGGMETQTSSVADKYLREAVCDTIYKYFRDVVCDRIFRDESCLLFFCALGAIFRKRAKPVTFSCEKSKT